MTGLFLGLVAIGIVYDWLTTFWLFRWMGRKAPIAGEVKPVTFFRPIKPGVANLGTMLSEFLASVGPEDQVLIGIYESDAISQKQVQQVLAAFPQVDTAVVPCSRTVAANPKINKLLQLAPLARHDFWIVMDSEIANALSFLPSFRAEWQVADFPVFSAPYRFQRLTLSSAPVLTTLLPGLAVLQRFGKIENTLGACLAVTRTHIAQLGGWSSVSSCLAEDYEIGHRLGQLGQPVKYSRAVCELENDPATLSSTFQKLHRISFTYRVCQPRGFAGSILVLSTFWSLLLFLVTHWKIAVVALLASWISQILGSFVRAQTISWRAPFLQLAWILPMSLLGEVFFWFVAWLPLPVHWARTWKVGKNGNMLPN